MAIYLPSSKSSKKSEKDILCTTRDVRTKPYMVFSYGLLHMDSPVLAEQQRLTLIHYVQMLDDI